MENIRDRLYKAVASVVAVDEDEFVPGASFVDDFNADSFDLVEITMNVEDEFAITIPTDDVPKLRTVGEVMEYVEKRVKENE